MAEIVLVSGKKVGNGSLVPFSEIPPGVGFVIRSNRGGMAVADRYYRHVDGTVYTADAMGNARRLADVVPTPETVVTPHVPLFLLLIFSLVLSF